MQLHVGGTASEMACLQANPPLTTLNAFISAAYVSEVRHCSTPEAHPHNAGPSCSINLRYSSKKQVCGATSGLSPAVDSPAPRRRAPRTTATAACCLVQLKQRQDGTSPESSSFSVRWQAPLPVRTCLRETRRLWVAPPRCLRCRRRAAPPGRHPARQRGRCHCLAATAPGLTVSAAPCRRRTQNRFFWLTMRLLV